jgi:cytochrome c oxidase cbb3-type subunit I/II
MWRAVDDAGQLMYPNFMETVTSLIPMYMLRAIGGTVFLAGAVVGGYNFYMTWRSRPDKYEEFIHQAPPLSATEYAAEQPPPSKLVGVSGVGKKLDTFSTLWWHRAWERLPVKFTVYTTIAVIIASLFEIIPTFLIRSNIPTIASVTPYTPLELYGRDIYVAEGCYNCHSQMIRPILPETKRYGEYSKPGESVYDHPFQWGSRRIGPDLARVGVTKPQENWHALHFEYPNQITPGTLMPPYPWLFVKKIDYSSIPARMLALKRVGVPYTEDQRKTAVDDAKKQAKQISDAIIQANGRADLEDKDVIALIAYMKRLGTDLNKPAPAAETTTTQPATAPAVPAAVPTTQQ